MYIHDSTLYANSRMYFGEHNVKAMFSVLEPLHLRMERGPETLKEISFNHVSYMYVSLWVCLDFYLSRPLSVSGSHVSVCRRTGETWRRRTSGARSFRPRAT